MSDAVDFIGDGVSSLFDFATSPFRAAGDLLFPDAPDVRLPEAQRQAMPDMSGVQGRRASLRRAQQSQGRRSLLFASRRNVSNTGQRPRASMTLGGGS
jgi:hypothetical protein